jgi:hypothetical protein
MPPSGVTRETLTSGENRLAPNIGGRKLRSGRARRSLPPSGTLA